MALLLTITSCPLTRHHQAIKGIVQECLRAMARPSLLGGGSRQFRAFVMEAKPQFDSQLLYMDVLIQDCQETVKVR